MAERQRQPVSPPLPGDRETLDEFSSILQRNFENLFQLAHRHSLRTTVPASNEGNVGDIFLVNANSTFQLYVKFPAGWKSVTLS